MGPEVNIDSIRMSEKQIEQGPGNVMQPKRAQNHLLNISTRVPPQTLGPIFSWSVIGIDPERDFNRLQNGSYDFLLVYHH